MLKKVFGEKLESEIYHDREAAYVVLSGRYSHAIGHFFYSDEYLNVCEPTETDEELLWLTYDEAIEGFYHPHHRWAVEYIWNNK